MPQPHVIDLALDLARMPAIARSRVVPALPLNIIELMRIAAASPEACEVAVARTGEPTPVVIEAARFYLQQTLFRPGADCYRILGIDPVASRTTARSHLRLLLSWLHPDHNNNSWDAVYAERVLKAWREVSASNGFAAKLNLSPVRVSSNRRSRRSIQRVRLPWIERPVDHRSLAMGTSHRQFILWAVPAVLVIIFLVLLSANVLLQP